MQLIGKALAEGIKTGLGGAVYVIRAARAPACDRGKCDDVAAVHALGHQREQGNLGRIVDRGDVDRVGSIAFRPLLIAQDAEGYNGKLEGACQLYGAIDHTGMGRKICGVKIKQMDAARTRRPELVFHAFHTVGASSGEHNILAWGYSPSDFSADIATAAQNQYASH